METLPSSFVNGRKVLGDAGIEGRMGRVRGDGYGYGFPPSIRNGL